MRTLLTVACVLMLSITHAQRVAGIRGGVNISNISHSNAGGIVSNNLQSFHAGFMANFPFLLFSFQPAVLVSGKGGEVTYGDPNSNNYWVAKTNPIYLEIPATFNLNIHFLGKTGLYVGAGPYFAMGFEGRYKAYGMRDGDYFSYSRKISFSEDAPAAPPSEEGVAYGNFRRFDYGATLNAGVFLAGINIGAYYDLGLKKINTLSVQGESMRNRTLGFTAGFVFD